MGLTLDIPHAFLYPSSGVKLFFDEARIHVQAGTGGNGCVSFRREKYVPLGGPDGGNGGPGGNVHLVVDPHQNTLINFRKRRHFKAGRGGHGRGKGQQGKAGGDLEIGVPPGTVVRDAETEKHLADLIEEGQKALVARGGRGGRGNAAFASPTNQAPRLAERGEPGEERWLLLELKLIADVGIIGCPNAGKSTLLSVCTAARPKIADYPFTTLTPNLGIVDLDDRSFVLVDIPGLIEGAHQGKGLGHDFLRHIERTRVLIHLLDGASKDPLQDHEDINRELALFNPALARKPQLAALNKLDLPQAQKVWPTLEREMKRREVETLAISALTGQGVKELLYRAAQLLEEAPPEPQREEIAIFRLPEEGFAIDHENGSFRVRGKRVERAVAMTDWRYREAIEKLQRELEAMGVTQALEEAGVQPGDTVYIGEMELEWWE